MGFEFAITLLLLFGPGVLAVVGLHRTWFSQHTHVRVIGASMAAVFVLALAGIQYRVICMERYFRTVKPGVLLSEVPFGPSYMTRSEETGLPLAVTWFSPAGDLVWSAEVDEHTGRILHIGGMWLCGAPQSCVYGSALFAAGGLVFYASLLACRQLLRWVIRRASGSSGLSDGDAPVSP
jgi:hypothetical protein